MRDEVANVGAETKRVRAYLPGKVVYVLKHTRPFLEPKTGSNRVDLAEPKMRNAVEKGWCDPVQIGRRCKGRSVEGVGISVALESKTKPGLIGQVRRDRVLKSRGQDPVLRIRRAVWQYQVNRLYLAHVLPRIAGGHQGALAEIAITTHIKLVGTDVVTLRAQVVISLVCNRGLER
jgi:hypothetical protein